MSVLDCESFETTIRSISDVYDVDVESVANFLRSVDLDKEFAEKVIYKNCDDYLKDLFELSYGAPKRMLCKVCWFHLTRVPEETDFAEGILPLGDNLDRIWNTLDMLLSSHPQKRLNVMRMRTDGVDNFHYNLKSPNTFHHGPYAMLVREAAFNAHLIHNHDYLEVPEIIEDICNGYGKTYCDDIYDIVTSQLRKVIVKFQSAKITGTHLLAPALLYCWSVVNEKEFMSFANTCYDSEGVIIPRDSILRVDFL